MTTDKIDLRTAADQMGVHYQTAYKWVRSGELPAARINGRYLLEPADVAALSERRARPTTRRRRPRQGYDDLARQMQSALIDGDENTARRLVDSLVNSGIPLTEAIQNTIVPTLNHIGAEWHAERHPIWIEHRASAIVDRILGQHHPTPRGRRRGTVIVAALAGDTHVLPTAMAAAALRQDNWRVHHLGADLPFAEILRLCEEHPVDLVVLSVSVPQTAESAASVANDLEEQGVRTLVGRPGATLEELMSKARARRAGEP